MYINMRKENTVIIQIHINLLNVIWFDSIVIIIIYDIFIGRVPNETKNKVILCIIIYREKQTIPLHLQRKIFLRLKYSSIFHFVHFPFLPMSA